MENVLQLWLNPINLGILFLCITVGIWILAHSDSTRRDKSYVLLRAAKHLCSQYGDSSLRSQ
jgi:hypothetical protein